MGCTCMYKYLGMGMTGMLWNKGCVGRLFNLVSSIELSKYSFPEDFSFGVGTSSYQIEGGAYEDGKTESIWDFNLHQNPSLVADGTNGDIACDSYHRWQEDINLVKTLGANFYRFSIAWTRILPSGYKGSNINEKGVAYYRKLIDGLLAEGIKPLVTIHHWDLPQTLQEKGGWLNESTIEDFVYYADILFQLYGDQVKHWITFNEPYYVCEYGYSGVELAPFLNMSGIGGYKCSHNLLLAHGKTYREYENKYKSTQKGEIGIAINSGWFEPKEDIDSDREAVERVLQFSYGWHMHPLILGNYPPIMIERIDRISNEEGYQQSRLPKFTDVQVKMIHGSYDFIGLNHYSTALIEFSENYEQPSFLYDCGIAASSNPAWETSPTLPGLQMVPWGLRKLLVWIKNEYGNPPLLITENGWPSYVDLNDEDRIRYMNEYLSEVLKAIHEDSCQVIGYSYWTLLDNFEWLSGFSTKFGLVKVDFSSPNRTRTPRKSYGEYKKIISSRKIGS